MARSRDNLLLRTGSIKGDARPCQTIGLNPGCAGVKVFARHIANGRFDSHDRRSSNQSVISDGLPTAAITHADSP